MTDLIPTPQTLSMGAALVGAALAGFCVLQTPLIVCARRFTSIAVKPPADDFDASTNAISYSLGRLSAYGLVFLLLALIPSETRTAFATAVANDARVLIAVIAATAGYAFHTAGLFKITAGWAVAPLRTGVNNITVNGALDALTAIFFTVPPVIIAYGATALLPHTVYQTRVSDGRLCVGILSDCPVLFSKAPVLLSFAHALRVSGSIFHRRDRADLAGWTN